MNLYNKGYMNTRRSTLNENGICLKCGKKSKLRTRRDCCSECGRVGLTKFEKMTVDHAIPEQLYCVNCDYSCKKILMKYHQKTKSHIEKVCQTIKNQKS